MSQGTYFTAPSLPDGGFTAPAYLGGSETHHSGILGTLLHVLGQGADDIAHIAVNSPAGLYHGTGMLIHHPGEFVQNTVSQIGQDFQHPLRHPGYTLADILGLAPTPFAVVDRAAELGRVAAGTSRWARAADGAETALTSSPARQALQAVVHGSPTAQRLVKEFDSKGNVVREQGGLYYSHNLGVRGAQKLLDKLHETYPDTRIPGVFAKQAARSGKAMLAENPINTGLSKLEATLLVKKYGKATDAEHEAVAMMGRGVMPEDQIKFIQGLIDGKKVHGFLLKNAEKWLARTKEAQKFIEPELVHTAPTFKLDETGAHVLDEGGQPIIEHNGGQYTLPRIREDAPKRLKEYVQDAKLVSDLRTKHLVENGYLDPQQAYMRALAPKSVIEGHGLLPSLKGLKKQLQDAVNFGHTEKEAEIRQQIAAVQDKLKGKGQMTLDLGEHTAGALPDQLSDPELAKHLFRIPEKADFATKVRDFVRPFKGGRVAEPTSLTKEYEAQVLQHGGPATNTARLIAESYVEAQRFLHLTNLRKQILAAARDTPDGIPDQYRLPIVEDYWNGKLPLGFQYPALKLREGIHGEEDEAASRWYEPLRQVLMEPKSAIDWANRQWVQHMTNPSSALQFVQSKGVPFTSEKDLLENRVPGIKWVDKRILGGMDKQNPLWSAMERPGFRRFMKTADFINDIQKTMMLYLKPAYLFPNMLGNVALSLVHQGFLAPLSMAKTLKVMFTGKGLSRESVASIRSTMGDGLSGSLNEKDRTIKGVVAQGSSKLANAYGKIIDDPFRFSAFLHEARAAGFTTLRDVEKLTTDPALEARLKDVAVRANDALINYERLGPGEQAIMRRLVFFYPWVKGSARYGYQLAINHPGATVATSVAGQQGTNFIHDTLGDLPIYAEGVFPWNGHEVTNPASAAVLGEDASVIENVKNLVQQNPNSDLSLFDNLSPVDSALYALITGNGTVGHKASEPRLMTAINELKSGNPLVGSPSALIENMTGGPANPNSLYPDNSQLHALLKFFALGGLEPRDFNRDAANYKAYQEQHPHG